MKDGFKFTVHHLSFTILRTMIDVEKVQPERTSKLLINVISIAVPIVVAILISLPNKLDLGAWTKTLPHVIGLINTVTSIALILGLTFIRLNKIHLHRAAMTFAFVLGALFLVCYVIYHLTNPENKFEHEGVWRTVYLIILLTHIALSIIVLPFVLRAMYYAVTGQYKLHKKLVRFAYPIWLYVSVTGVVVYLMLYQLFPR